MKKQVLKITTVVYLITISMIWFACQEEPIIENGVVNFNVLSKSASKIKGSKSYDLNDAEKVIITVQENDGSPTDYTQYELNVYKMGDAFITKKIALPFGAYKITEFYIIDALDSIIYASPIEGSLIAQNVNDPLPILFDVTEKQSNAVDVEVISTENLKPEDFGLIRFPIIEIETFQFLINVSELSTDQLLKADLTISSGIYSYSQELDSIVDNIVTVKDEYTEYILTIETVGYQTYIDSLTNNELKEYDSIPMIVELEAETDLYRKSDVFIIGRDIATNENPRIIRVDKNGNLLYNKAIPLTTFLPEICDRNITEDAIYLVKSSYDENNDTILKLNKNGDLVWKIFPFIEFTYISSDPVYGGIWASNKTGIYKISANGDVILGPLTFTYSSFYRISTNVLDGGCYVVSGIDSPDTESERLLKIDNDGNLLWELVFESAEYPLANPINGGVYLGAGGYSMNTSLIDANGNTIWQKTNYPSSYTYGRAVNPVDGSLYIGSGWGNYLINVDINGNETFRIIDTPDYNAYVAADVDGEGCYVGNWCSNGSDATRYDANGNLLWANQYGPNSWWGSYGVANVLTGVPIP